MAREYTCAYGECRRTDTKVIVTHGDARPRFCTTFHAVLFLLREAAYSHADAPVRRKLGAAYDDLSRLPETKEGG